METVEYYLKSKNEDFEVTEVPLLPTILKKGKYTYIWLKKSNFSTFEAQDKLKDFFKLKYEDINVEGLKDEDGVTFQIFSVRKNLKEIDIKLFNKKYYSKTKYIILERIMGYGDTPVSERMLHGNSFNIVVRNLKEGTALKVLEYCKNNRFFNFINYYDSQRFGMPGKPHVTHLIGKAVIENNWKEVYKQFKISGNEGLPKDFIDDKKKTENDYRKIFEEINHKKLNFFKSSYNSFLWNKEISHNLKSIFKTKSFIFKNVGKLSVPNGNSFTVLNLLSQHGHRLENVSKISKKYNTRSVVVTTVIFVLGLEDDDMNKNRKKVRLSFFLPTGSYATMCIRQLIYKATLNKK